MSVNKVILVGRLGADPELKYTSSGAAVAHLRIATDSTWTNKAGEKESKTEWHRVSVWGKQAEHCGEYLRKGRQVYVEGRLQTNSWETKEGEKRYSTEINANQVTFLGSKNDGAGASSKTASSSMSSVSTPSPMEDDIPF